VYVIFNFFFLLDRKMKHAFCVCVCVEWFPAGLPLQLLSRRRPSFFLSLWLAVSFLRQIWRPDCLWKNKKRYSPTLSLSLSLSLSLRWAKIYKYVTILVSYSLPHLSSFLFLSLSLLFLFSLSVKMSWLGKGTLKVDQNQMLLDELHQNSYNEYEQIARLTLQSLLKT